MSGQVKSSISLNDMLIDLHFTLCRKNHYVSLRFILEFSTIFLTLYLSANKAQLFSHYCFNISVLYFFEKYDGIMMMPPAITAFAADISNVKAYNE